MKKFIVAGIAATSLLATSAVASAATFNIDEPLDTPGALVSPWVASGTVTPYVISDFETPSTALRLTDATEAQAGFALYNEAISVTRGIDVTFHQAQWGGSGADGIVFFVKKGDDTSTTPGAAGGSMGYASSTDNDGDAGNGLIPVNGLSGALLGIGLDSYGNFGSTGSDGTDCSTTFNRGGGNSIVVRGAGQGTTGYCMLADSFSLNSNGLPLLSSSFGSRESADRVVRVVIDPATASDPRVNVYYENELVIDIPLPAAFNTVSTVKIGFAAGTGGLNNNHDVWGLSSVVASSSGGDEGLAPTGGSETVGVIALVLGIMATIAAVALRPRRRVQQ
jgi:hypothetical protein